MPDSVSANPLLTLGYEPALSRLGDDYSDPVHVAEFPHYRLRFRNDPLVQQLFGLDPQQISDTHWVEAFGQFYLPAVLESGGLRAMRYHGYQFGTYNPRLGDGRGFLAAQVRSHGGLLYDWGTKGSGTTPYSRGGDGRLTLKGGVREIIATETLARMGVRTSHSLSLIETGEELYRGDEPSPTRSSLLVRCQRSHLRFGTFERLLHLSELEKVPPLLEHIIEHYYPHVQGLGDRYARFYAELVARVARLAAQWMAAGFCHAVLNTDNMAVTGESFDYGPFAFIPTLDPRFTAAYFDHGGRYAYANQPGICLWNLEMLQRPLNKAIAQTEMDSALAQFSPLYQQAYRDCMLAKLGLGELLPNPDTLENVLGSSAASVQLDPGDSAAVEDDQWQMIKLTLQFLQVSQVSYGGFFARLRQTFSPLWWEDAAQILPGDLTDLGGSWAADEAQHLLGQWRSHYHRILTQRAQTEIPEIARRLAAANPLVVPVRPEIEAAWEKITIADDWSGLEDLLARIRA